MSIGTGDLLQITDFQEYLGEQVLNVYYYRWSSAPTIDNSAYVPLLEFFQAGVVALVSVVQSGLLEHVSLQIKNLSNGVDFAEIPVNGFGGGSTDMALQTPSFMALSWRFLRDSLVTRNGSKRIAGILENAISGNEFVGSMGVIDPITQVFQDPLKIGLINVAYPIIVKRPIAPPVGTGYQYSSVSDVIFNGVSTQNTRKQGRGA